MRRWRGLVDLKIRNLPEDVERTLREMKQVHRMSLAAAAIRLMRRGRNGVAEGSERPHEDPAETPQRPQRKKFEPPSEEEAKAHHREKGYHFSLAEWFAYYEVRGWVPKGSTRMAKSWKGLMVTWESRWKEKQGADDKYKLPPPVKYLESRYPEEKKP